MPGVTTKDINQQEFVRARAVFLKKSPKGWTQSSWPKIKSLPLQGELLLYMSFFHSTAPVPPWWCGVNSMTKIYEGQQRNGVRPSLFSRGSKSLANWFLQALERSKIVERDQDRCHKLIPQGQNNLDRNTRQVAVASKTH